MATTTSALGLRRHDLDNLRTYLTSLVITHHTSIIYGGLGQWPYKSPLSTGGSSVHTLPLLLFQAYNQSFFMGLFFWISGRASAQSLSRSDQAGDGRWNFLKKRFTRLALPSIMYSLTIAPLVRLVAARASSWSAIKGSLATYFGSIRGVTGPVWFTATLFCFDTLAALITTKSVGLLNPKEPIKQEGPGRQKQSQLSGYFHNTLTLHSWIGIAALCFACRLFFPVGQSFRPLSLQLGYAPQYVFAYTIGHLSALDDILRGPFSREQSNHNTTKRIKYSTVPSLAFATTVSMVSFIACLLPLCLSRESHSMAQGFRNLSGGWNLSAGSYALWNEFSFMLVGPALMAYFRRWHNRLTKSGIIQPRYSYVAFLIHPVVTTVTAVTIDYLLTLLFDRKMTQWAQTCMWKICYPLVMTLVSSFLNVCGSFILGRWVLDKIPVLSWVL